MSADDAPRSERPRFAGGPPVPLPLAQGELDERDAGELRELKEQIRLDIGFQPDGYKEKCFRRRLAVRMRARGVLRYGEYGALLRSDPAEYRRLLETVTINVSKFFRNPEVWTALSELALPALFGRTEHELRIWSAGSAGGEEPYTLAMLVREFTESKGLLDRLGRVRITATDIDRDALETARRAEYGAFAMTDAPPHAVARWFTPGPPYRLHPEIRAMVRFEEGDLMMPGSTRGLHLVVCRNVIIYFERLAQEELFRRFSDAIVPGGYLVLGKVEALLGEAVGAFRPVSNRDRIFQRV